MDVLHWIRNTFWNERFWLPSNYTWKDLESNDPNLIYPTIYQIYMTIPVGITLLVLRYVVETYVFRPIGRFYGLQEKDTRRVTPNRAFEKIYKKCRKPTADQVKELATKNSMSTRSIELWFHGRRNMDKYSLLKKFSESGWRFTFYLCAFVGGVWSLWSKPFFWDTKECWLGYPKQPIDTDMYWYYMIELGFYWSLLVSVFSDVKRKDFYEMVIHHIATISLLVFSWVCNFVRVGTLVLAVHDAADYWMESAKMAKYIGKHKLCDVIFCIFTFVWFCTRLTIYPFRILRTTIFEGLIVAKAEAFPAYYLINGLLSLLQLLNFVWFCFIMKMMIEIFTIGQLQKDARSDSELSDDEVDANGNEIKSSSNDNKEEVVKKYANGFSAHEENGTMVIEHRTKH